MNSIITVQNIHIPYDTFYYTNNTTLDRKFHGENDIEQKNTLEKSVPLMVFLYNTK